MSDKTRIQAVAELAAELIARADDAHHTYYQKRVSNAALDRAAAATISRLTAEVKRLIATWHETERDLNDALGKWWAAEATVERLTREAEKWRVEADDRAKEPSDASPS